MKMPGFRAAVERYEKVRAPEDHRIDLEIPLERGVVYAAATSREPKETRFSPPMEAWVALCGRSVRAITPLDFNAGLQC